MIVQLNDIVTMRYVMKRLLDGDRSSVKISLLYLTSYIAKKVVKHDYHTLPKYFVSPSASNLVCCLLFIKSMRKGKGQKSTNTLQCSSNYPITKPTLCYDLYIFLFLHNAFLILNDYFFN